ncbi:hypothetical protein [Paludibacterium purpuratum]|uniref:EamA-like transporter family protein n=1 Tax=Paludibacterium purpuratum TaxID=1144873 RepID=A0A4R7B859_9NEIS|nr:hypothetical protein [Paludibacterium purpuratum]TDR80713.1 hypothetical protein DFP86_104213 [Paludibacterium purpuratum]
MIHIAIYILLTVFSSIMVFQTAGHLSYELLVLLCTSFAIVFFHIANKKNIISVYRKLLTSHRRLYFLLMASILVIWMGYFAGAHYITPNFFAFLFMGLGALFSSIATYRTKKSAINIAIIALIALSIFLFYCYIFSAFPIKAALGIFAFSILLGYCNYLYAHTSQSLAIESGIDASQILAVRFWLMFAVSLAIVVYEKQYIDLISTPNTIFYTFLLAIATFIAPIYFYQKSILKIGADRTLLLCGLIPFSIFIAEYAIGLKLQTTWVLGALSALLACATVLRLFTPRS